MHVDCCGIYQAVHENPLSLVQLAIIFPLPVHNALQGHIGGTGRRQSSAMLSSGRTTDTAQSRASIKSDVER